MRIQEDRKIFALYYMTGFFAGILYGNLQSKDYIISMGIFNEYFLNQYSVNDLDTLKYMLYVAKIRIIPGVLLGALGCTKFRKEIAAGFVLWTGFSSGLLITSAVMKMGVKGIVFCLLALIPHFMFYIAAYFLLLMYLYFYPKVRWSNMKTVVFLLFLLVGILLESYVNPVVMQMFLGTL